MSLMLHRSQRVEDLVGDLANALLKSLPEDPFEPLQVIVGSRGMERWLRHELATRLGSVARIDFVLPRAAFYGAARWLAQPEASESRIFWNLDAARSDGWSGPSLELRVLAAMRRHINESAFAQVLAYVGSCSGAVKARELSFARDVAGTLERLLHDRPQDALEWTKSPDAAPPEYAWLAMLLRDLDANATEPSPARSISTLNGPAVRRRIQLLHVFGLSTLRPGDKLWMEALARHFDVHLYALAPSSVWCSEIKKSREQIAALKAASRPDDIARLLANFSRDNALLAANGGPSRDLQVWLERTDHRELHEHAVEADSRTLLANVQEWIDGAADNPRRDETPWKAHAHDGSLEVHACHGALRQCEALRDELLRRFKHDRTLEPRHVLVMTPDIATYAPLLAAVFARSNSGTPAIPLAISDLGLRVTNPVADALLQALTAADERITASRLLGFLALHPVRARFGIAEHDRADLHQMVVESGMRWGWDADDRSRHEQPPLEQNTILFGLERLALGVLMPDPGGIETVRATKQSQDIGVVPLELATRERVARFGRFSELCLSLHDCLKTLPKETTVGHWRERLRALLDATTRVDGPAAWLRVQVDRTLDELLPKKFPADLTLHRTALLALLENAFELPLSGDRPVTGAVTVCALESMRSVPFRVIAMLGFDDGAFPRPTRVAAWDPFSIPRPGEYDRRTVDRHIFLEAVLCARDALLIFGTGFEPKRGEPVPMSVVVSELLELISAGTESNPERKPDEVAIRHSLQPWSDKAFQVSVRLPFDSQWAEAAEKVCGERQLSGLAATPANGPWPAEDETPCSVTAEELARALVKPQQELLQKRLALALDPDDTEVADREPLELDSLENWSVRDRVLQARGASTDFDDLERRLRGEGTLPLSAAGRSILEKCTDEARQALDNAQKIPGTSCDALLASCTIGGIVVTAVGRDVRDDGGALRLVWTTASRKPSNLVQLTGWISMLVAVADGRDVVSAHVVGFETTKSLLAPASALDAQAILSTLVEKWKQVRSSPRMLFPEFSRKVAEAYAKAPTAPSTELVAEASDLWDGAMKDKRYDRDDPWVAALFGHLDIDDLAEYADEIVAQSIAVWGPCISASAMRKKAADQKNDITFNAFYEPKNKTSTQKGKRATK